ncbi:substrate-binding domain-containing protein, partial [Streptomyces sp. NPDC055144]
CYPSFGSLASLPQLSDGQAGGEANLPVATRSVADSGPAAPDSAVLRLRRGASRGLLPAEGTVTIAKKFFSKPQLTTVRQPVEEMAGAMARLLQEHIEGTRTEPTSLIFEPELVLRQSA